MLKPRSLSILLVLLGTGIATGVLLTNHLAVKTVEAQQNLHARWEHCRLGEYGSSTDRFGKFTSYANIEYYQQAGIKREEIKNEQSTALSQAIAKLGEEGWEMAGLEARENQIPVFYFKRLKR